MLQMNRSGRARVWIAALLLLLAMCGGMAVATEFECRKRTTSSSPKATPPQNDEDVLLPPEGVNPDKPQAETPTPPVLPSRHSANQPSDTVNLPAGREAEKNSNGTFVFKTEVQEVTLHATVVDDHQRPVTTLDRAAFQVFEDGQPQRITSFRREDIPVALAIVIDNSGSMRDKRPGVNAAALNLVRSSNPQDQVCVINFNDEYYLDQDYTGNVGLLQDALGAD